MPYNAVDEPCTWADSTVRAWLNDSFVKEAFSEADIEQLIPVSLGLNESETDIVFLPSEQELRNCMTFKTERKAKATCYAASHGGWTNKNGECYYWVRSSSVGKKNKTLYAATDGEFASFNCSNRNRCVRPAVWLKFNTVVAE